MSKFSNFMRRNRLYVWLVFFILLVNAAAFIGTQAAKNAEKETVAVQGEQALGDSSKHERMKMFDEEEMKARQEGLMNLVDENPTLYIFLGILNLVILFAILLGIVLDIYLLIRWTRREPIDIQLAQPEKARWNMGDIVRVTLIFLSLGCVLMLLQGYAGRAFPILNNENFRMIFNTAIMNIVVISIILHFIVVKYGHGISAIGLTSKNITKSIFWGASAYIVLLPILMAIMIATFYIAKLLSYHPPVQPIVQVFIEEKESSILWMSALFAAIFGPIAEEIFFRGFIYPAVKKKVGVFWGILGTAIIFSVLHTHIVGFLPILVLGFLLAYIYEKTGSLVAPITVHIIHNLGMVGLVFLMRNVSN